MKVRFNRPSGFRGEDIENIDGGRTTTDRVIYVKLTYEPEGSGELK